MPQKPVRLPPLPRLKVRKPLLQTKSNPCMVVMSTLLNCWASNGEGSQACKELELSLKACMDTNKGGAQATRSSINYHAGRLYPKISGKSHD
ncbi:37S ribosomal protein, mitochondrial [Komagataella phaffii CBS 7435]|uniref:Small ribosomal subunit protein mS37 n=2 Tax=Komagataella phaffii TaxID=460519 RepID=C4QWX9_KOMPG|nr:mitochondrial 37S ribosomal protein YmS-T [Komagataella phaffii GS115]KAI0464869.1 hypothetical protein LJB42_000080 [Komagataella kurtzmanii]CAH2446546.1 37S ribosomal protein, mitochondrial [Komagataella phaffii CBS 7435]CAY67752.1 Mitochondrial ribosomal protein of the small subunit [Komagataella phaffii GS115]SCV11835.1 37S ribosomal protein, mitochondrial [Komagataella phaffii CBS 7435]